MAKNNDEVMSATIIGVIPMITALLVIFLPLLIYFSEKGWYRANKEALHEKEKYANLFEENNIRQGKLDQSMKAYSENNEKAIVAKTEFETKQRKLVQDFNNERAALQKEFADKVNDFQADVNKKQQDMAKSKKETDKLLADAQKLFTTAKTLEEEANKEFLKNHGEGEAIVKMIDDLKSVGDAIAKNCDNYDKTNDPFFLDVIEKRIFDNYKKVAEVVNAGKQLNMKFNNKNLKNAIELADAQLVRASKKLKGNVPK